MFVINLFLFFLWIQIHDDIAKDIPSRKLKSGAKPFFFSYRMGLYFGATACRWWLINFFCFFSKFDQTVLMTIRWLHVFPSVGTRMLVT